MRAVAKGNECREEDAGAGVVGVVADMCKGVCKTDARQTTGASRALAAALVAAAHDAAREEEQARAKRAHFFRDYTARIRRGRKGDNGN
jgi:hypothetical protein